MDPANSKTGVSTADQSASENSAAVVNGVKSAPATSSNDNSNTATGVKQRRSGVADIASILAGKPIEKASVNSVSTSNKDSEVSGSGSAGVIIPQSKQNGHTVLETGGKESRLSSTSTEVSVFENSHGTSGSKINNNKQQQENSNKSGGASKVDNNNKSNNTLTAATDTSQRKESTESIRSNRSAVVTTGVSNSVSARPERRKSTIVPPPKSAAPNTTKTLPKRRTSTAIAPSISSSRRDSLISSASTGGGTNSRRVSLADLAAVTKNREIAQLMGKLNKLKDSSQSPSSKTANKDATTVGGGGDSILVGDTGGTIMNGIEEEGSQAGDEGPPVLDPKVIQVLEGSLKDLPSLPSRIVRIFTSSTFTGQYHVFVLVVY